MYNKWDSVIQLSDLILFEALLINYDSRIKIQWTLKIEEYGG